MCLKNKLVQYLAYSVLFQAVGRFALTLKKQGHFQGPLTKKKKKKKGNSVCTQKKGTSGQPMIEDNGKILPGLHP